MLMLLLLGAVSAPFAAAFLAPDAIRVDGTCQARGRQSSPTYGTKPRQHSLWTLQSQAADSQPVSDSGSSGKSAPKVAKQSGTHQADNNEVELLLEICGEIKHIPQDEWDSLITPETSPFLEWDWIHALEASGCATELTGWRPLHVAVRQRAAGAATEDEAEELPKEREEGTEGDTEGSTDEATGPEGTSKAGKAKRGEASSGAQGANGGGKGELIAAVPLYLKGHSQGEFIFDQQWAEAAYGAGIKYYPKLLCAVPFTPASGARILVKPDLDPALRRKIFRVIGGFLRDLAANSGLSSVHINFCTLDEVEAMSTVGYLHRQSLQWHWRNEDRAATGEGGVVQYKDFESYLSNFASRKRIKIRRERRFVYEEAGLQLKVWRGCDIPYEMYETMYEIYKTTIDKLYWGRQYLNVEFFRMLRGRFSRNLCFITAERDGKILAGTFNVVKAGRFYGRYWGAFEYVKNMHFETCYYKGIEYCIEQGLATMEPGAGGGDFKFLRGFDPAIVHSVHLCTNPGLQKAIRNFLTFEREQIDETAEKLTEQSALADRQITVPKGQRGAKQEQEQDAPST